MWVRIPLVELIFPSFFPFYLSSSPSDLRTPPFFQSTRREIGSETTDNLSENNPVKNAYCASAHALILSYPSQYRSTLYAGIWKSRCICALFFALATFITNKRRFFSITKIYGLGCVAMHLLVPLLFHAVTSLHPPSFHRNDFSTCINGVVQCLPWKSPTSITELNHCVVINSTSAKQKLNPRHSAV